jgi:hypothetical protein
MWPEVHRLIAGKGAARSRSEHSGGLLLVEPDVLVAPAVALIIMTVDDLENIEVSTYNFSIAELLSDYSHECPDRMRSLHNFIEYSSKYQAKMLANTMLSEKATELMAQVQSRLFPSDSENPEA